MKEERKKCVSFIFLAIYVLVFVLLRNIIEKNVYLYFQFISYFALAVAGVFFFRDYYRESIDKWRNKPVKCIIWLIAAFLADLILTNVSIIFLYLYNPDYNSINQSNVANVMEVFPRCISIIILGICGPVVEEYIYRLILIRKQENYLNAGICIFVSALCFMMMHMKNISIAEFLANLPIFVGGLIYGFVCYKSKNFTIPLILHFINNIPAVL